MQISFPKKSAVLLFASILFINGCSYNYGRYQQKNDSKPARMPTNVELKDATPRKEDKSKGGNKNYQVGGKHYTVLESAQGYQKTGIASWYGKKFHGHLTSNGEIYNMYGMSAAHKTLPLPTYVQVTNLNNNKTVIVRVNDRGPFHQDRVIDLSYSAAVKLDMLKTGTANVAIKAITDFSPKPTVLEKPAKYVIQILATRNQQSAQKSAQTITSLFQLPAFSKKQGNLYRVQIGPYSNKAQLNKALKKIKSNGYPNAYRIKI